MPVNTGEVSMLVVDPARVLKQMQTGSQKITGDWNGDISLALGLLDVEAVPDNCIANNNV